MYQERDSYPKRLFDCIGKIGWSLLVILRGGVVRALRIGMEVKEVGEGEGEGNSKEVDRVGIRTTIIIIIMQVEEEVGDEILGKLRCSRVCAEKRTDFEVEFWERFSQVTCYKCGQMGHFANKYVPSLSLVVRFTRQLTEKFLIFGSSSISCPNPMVVSFRSLVSLLFLLEYRTDPDLVSSVLSTAWSTSTTTKQSTTTTTTTK